MIRLVISDVDGTMVKESSPQMYPAYFEVIRKLRQKGIYVVIASGRQYPSVRRLFHEVEDLVWIIGDGGATLKMDSPVEAFKEIPREWVREAWADARKIPDGDGILCAPQCAYAPDENSEMFRLMKENYHYSIESLHGWDTLPVYIIQEDGRLEICLKGISAQVGGADALLRGRGMVDRPRDARRE